MLEEIRQNVSSDAQWYCRRDSEEDCFYNIFFMLCRKYNVNWASASEKEKCFIEEVTRVTYERDKAKRLGMDVSSLQPAFAC